MRKESDFLGQINIPKDALYGIHSVRAKENFPNNSSFPIEWYKAVGMVKLAAYNTYKNFKNASLSKYKEIKNIQFFKDNLIEKLIESATEISEGKHFNQFIVPAIQGGAGTSINLNINEIIANLTLQKLNSAPGNYKKVHPIDHANIYQSTNDVIPTALKLTIIQLLNILEESINELRFEIEKLENKHRNDLRIGYTQMQAAVPSSFGLLFSTYNEALSRDWWRVSKCFERIKIVNLGGGAIGTGLAIPRYFIIEVVNTLQKLTNLPITRSENLSDATNNLDAFVEIHATIKSHAVNLEKMVNDIRIIASDLVGKGEISIPKKQVGSSIMPSKVNPVIPEFVISSTHKIYSNDLLISNLCAQGNLELNAYLPIIGNAIIESINLLISCNKTLKRNLFAGLEVNGKLALDNLLKSPSITTALLPYIGYTKATQIANLMREKACDIYEANNKFSFLKKEKLEQILSAQNLLKTGFTLKDLEDEI
jgi:aspartate ammonia-lyase